LLTLGFFYDTGKEENRKSSGVGRLLCPTLVTVVERSGPK